jgi:hypothetical protein
VRDKKVLLRYVLAWLVALGVAGQSLRNAWAALDNPRRNDGNYGHTTVDFGGQWLMGRMLVRGEGRHLYDRNRLRPVVQAAYPRQDGDPGQENSDADNLMAWLMGEDDPHAPVNVGGTLYPPVHAFFCAPLGLLEPRPAYRAWQCINLVLAFVAGWGIRLLARGRIWWPVAAAGVIIFPGFTVTVVLGQNSALTLTLLVWGWVLIARGKPGWGGAVWGLLAFKPVWAAAFFLVPLLTRRWRVCLAMLATGAALAAATLPFVGWHSWLAWFHIGRTAAGDYQSSYEWVFLSRDLINLPRRWLADFSECGMRHAECGIQAADLAGWGLFLTVLAATTSLALRRPKQVRAVTGPPAAFLFLGAWMACYHFMYYDVLVAALPVFLLLIPPSPDGERMAGPFFRRGVRGWVRTGTLAGLLLALLAYEHIFTQEGGQELGFPLDTVCLGLLWVWCGWQVVSGEW